ncbi:MAG: Ig-like domain-containing protein [Gemmatimonadota bacterium]
MIKLAGDGQIALPGAVLPESLVIVVEDQQGSGVSGVTVSWQAAGSGTVAPASAVTDVIGRIAARWTVGTLGNNTVTATSGSLSVTFTATVTNNPPSQLGINTQPSDGQSGVPLPTQPVVQLLDGSGAAVAQSGVSVAASLAPGSSPFASLDGNAIAVTASNGQASFPDLGITGPVGNYTFKFTASGLTAVNSAAIALSTISGRVPLIDMGNRTYLGFTGRLYPGSNVMPSAHAQAAAARARNIEPLNAAGNPSPGGKFVLLSVGISNAAQEWCDVVSFPCTSWSFTGQALADNAVNHSSLAIMNGAQGGQTTQFWDSPTDPDYDRVRDSVLTPMGLTEAQVQIVWLKTFNADPTVSLPAANADAILLVTQYGNILRALKVRYPNLQMVFMSSRIYGGYGLTGQNPEPYAYETGFAVKWTIQAQIDQMANGGTVVDARAGDLDYGSIAPWVGWGPYLWADGLNPRSDGLTWLSSDMESDGTHPGIPAETKVGNLLLQFFKTDIHSSCWFLAGGTCP